MGISSLPRITHILGGRAGNQTCLTIKKGPTHLSVLQRCPYIEFILASFSILEVCRQKALELSPKQPCCLLWRCQIRREMEFFWSVSEHAWQIQNQKSYSENAHLFAASFVYINAHLPQESFFQDMTRQKCV